MASAGGRISDEVPIFHAENLTSNVKSINYSRTFLSIISGVVAGIWGFTGLMGFVFYLLVMMVASLGLLMKAKFSVHTYFDSWNRILLEGVTSGLMSYGPFPPNRMVVTAVLLLCYFGHFPMILATSSNGWNKELRSDISSEL